MDLSTLETYIIAAAPSIAAVFGIVSACVTIMKNVKGIKTDVNSEMEKTQKKLSEYKKENNDLKEIIKTNNQEIYELSKEVRALTREVRRIDGGKDDNNN